MKLVEKLAPLRFEALDKFHSHKLQPREALCVSVHDMKMLLGQLQAMPGLDQATCDQLLLHQFLAGLHLAVSYVVDN